MFAFFILPPSSFLLSTMSPLSLIVLFPLLGFVFNGLVGAKLKKPLPGYVATLAVFASFVVAVLNVLQLATLPEGETRRITEHLYTWISAGSFSADVSFLLDPLSAVMILVITGIGALIHLYSVGYMQDDSQDPAGKLNARYFAWLNLFVAFMSVLVLADNYLLMFVGWEGVGLCSYFLIGFWFTREDAAMASKKAFIMNRIGDFGFLLGMMLLFIGAGTLKYYGTPGGVGNLGVLDGVLRDPQLLNKGILAGLGGTTLIALLLFVGACGKSAQIPLYTWLPDAMAGPTPVSALIHAATMVTAGVYICARSSAIFEIAPEAKAIIVVIGTLTALFAGLTALAHNDIKKVLAYSTVSQLGFMFMAIGSGAYVAAIFHVFTHAFFKACLFLGAGSVIHSLHGEQDMRKMGGLSVQDESDQRHLHGFQSGAGGRGALRRIFLERRNHRRTFQSVGVRAALSGDGSTRAVRGVHHRALQRTPIRAGVSRQSARRTFIRWRTRIAVHHDDSAVCSGGGRGAGGLSRSAAHSRRAGATARVQQLAVAGFRGARRRRARFGVLPSTSRRRQLGQLDFAFRSVWQSAGAAGCLGRSLGIKNGEHAVLEGAVSRLSLDSFYQSAVVAPGAGFSRALAWIDDNVIDGVVNAVGAFVGASSDALRTMQTSYVRNYALVMALCAAILVGFFSGAFDWLKSLI